MSFVQETLEKCLSSYQNVWFCCCTEIYALHKTTYLWSMKSPGGGELSLSACPGMGNRPPNENKIANPRGYARGGMVTGRIEPCINRKKTIMFLSSLILAIASVSVFHTEQIKATRSCIKLTVYLDSSARFLLL